MDSATDLALGPRADQRAAEQAARAEVDAPAQSTPREPVWSTMSTGRGVCTGGALLRTLARLPCRKHSDATSAWHTIEAYLMLRAQRLDHPIRAAAELVRYAAPGACAGAWPQVRAPDTTSAR